jgi:hypothetical protein
MKGLFTKEQAIQIIVDYKYLIGNENYIDPYPFLKVGYIRTEMESDGTFDIFIGVAPSQLLIPEFMGFTKHEQPLLIFLHLKDIPFDCDKYGF